MKQLLAPMLVALTFVSSTARAEVASFGGPPIVLTPELAAAHERGALRSANAQIIAATAFFVAGTAVAIGCFVQTVPILDEKYNSDADLMKSMYFGIGAGVSAGLAIPGSILLSDAIQKRQKARVQLISASVGPTASTGAIASAGFRF